MVFIELRSNYIESFSSSPEMVDVINFILNKTCNSIFSNQQTGLDGSVNHLIQAIFKNDGDLFSEMEDLYKRKNPDSHSPWINNNYLIFFLLIGQDKFNRDRSWLKSAIGFRKRNDVEGELILEFFNSILSNSNITTGPLSPFHLIYLYHVRPDSIGIQIVNGTLNELNKSLTFPLFNSEFLNILYLGAFQVAFLSKDIAGFNLNYKVVQFRTKLNSRISAFSNVVLYFLFLLFLSALFLFVKYIFLNLSEAWRNGIVTVIGLLGLTLLEVFRGRGKLKGKIEKRLGSFLKVNLLD